MLNNITLVGRLVSKPQLEKTESGKSYAKIVLAVSRSYKNEEGIYETDFIDILLHNYVAESTCEWCEKGDLIGIKGRIETRFEEDKENELSRKITYLVAERVSFLATARKESE